MTDINVLATYANVRFNMASSYLFIGLEKHSIRVSEYVGGYYQATFIFGNQLLRTDGTPNHIKQFVRNILIAAGKKELFGLITLEFGEDILNIGSKEPTTEK